MALKSNVVNNLTTTASGKILDARQGKALNDKFNNKQDKLTFQYFNFSPNPSGVTSSGMQCYQYGQICLVCGDFIPNQAGTPLTLGSFSKKPVNDIRFLINAYEKVASFGHVSSGGMFMCNIPNALVNVTCAVNFIYITND